MAGRRMASKPSSAAGGILIAIGALAGTAVGFSYGEVTPGFLIGIAAGGALAVLVWVIDRNS